MFERNRPRLAGLGRDAGSEFVLAERETSLGSAPGNDIVLDDRTVSRRHAKLTRHDGVYRLIDLNSTNGTFVNGRRIDAPTVVKNGDELRFGALRFTLIDNGGARTSRRRTGPTAIVAAVALLFIAGFTISEYVLNWSQIEEASTRDDSLGARFASANAKTTAGSTDRLNDLSRKPIEPTVPSLRHASAAEIAAAKPWLDPLNFFRSLAGLPSVEPDPALSAADAAHSRYLVENFAARIKSNSLGAEAHTEDPARPGYTPQGQRAAEASDIEEGYNPRVPDWLSPSKAIAGWISLPFHRLWILNPDLKRAGYGQYCDSGMCAGALDLGTGAVHVRNVAAPYDKPIQFPPAGATIAMRSAEGEWPDPLTACPGYSQPMGLPITLQLGSYVDPKLTAYSLMLNGEANSKIETCGFDAATYVNPDPAQQERVRSILSSFGAVVVIPRAPLTPGSYTVSITADGQSYTWPFQIRP